MPSAPTIRSAWVDFMMRFELGLEEPDPRRALTSALTIAGAYIVGGLIPLGPTSSCRADAHGAAGLGARSPLLALGVFGYVKGLHRGAAARSAQTMLIGGLPPAAAFAIARVIS